MAHVHFVPSLSNPDFRVYVGSYSPSGNRQAFFEQWLKAICPVSIQGWDCGWEEVDSEFAATARDSGYLITYPEGYPN
jgi:hypothetical protein